MREWFLYRRAALGAGVPFLALLTLALSITFVESKGTRQLLAVGLVPAGAVVGLWLVYHFRHLSPMERLKAFRAVRNLAIVLGSVLVGLALYRAALGQWSQALSSIEAVIFACLILWTQRRQASAS